MAKDLRATRDYMRDKRAGTLNGKKWTDYKNGGSSNGNGTSTSPAPTTQVKQTPTHARNIQDMNEAQLDREIALRERWVAAEEREINRLKNSSGIKDAEDLMARFPGGVGGSAVNSRYRRIFDSYDNAMTKLAETQAKYDRNTAALAEMKAAKEAIKGTGTTLRTVATATASKGNGEWKKTTFNDGGTKVNAKEMGDYIAAKPFFTYNLYDKRTGNRIRTFKTFKALDAWVRKNG